MKQRVRWERHRCRGRSCRGVRQESRPALLPSARRIARARGGEVGERGAPDLGRSQACLSVTGPGGYQTPSALPRFPARGSGYASSLPFA